MKEQNTQLTPEQVIRTYQNAKERRRLWESHWNECYDYALPLRSTRNQPGAKTADKLFDGTAPDAVDQLAASLLANLTPPWSKWIGLMVGPDVQDEDIEAVTPKLDHIAETLQFHFDRSNFTIEIHQCFLDLVTAGTACLMLEESPLGEASAFQFTAVPLFDVVFEDSAAGRLDGTLRRLELTPRELKKRYPSAPSLGLENNTSHNKEDIRISVIEAVIPDDKGFAYMAVAEPTGGILNDVTMLAEGRFESSPFINFRWLKAPGEIYGRSPVMKALPDIKTANKVVELILKNASIAVTGIWMAEDDGVLNPANIKLVPGAIIPKAVGSKGLIPLESPAKLDTSNIVLGDMRDRIRSALVVDKLGRVVGGKMSATEVLERASDTARALGATYGRLQSELLTPLVERAMSILRRRGEIPPITLDGRTIDIDYRSPLARRQAKEDAQNTIMWISTIRDLGPQASSIIDAKRTARWLARAFSVPDDLLLSDEDAAKVLAGNSAGLSPGNPIQDAMAQNPQILEQLGSLMGGGATQKPSVAADVPISEAISPLDSAHPPTVSSPQSVTGAATLRSTAIESGKGIGNV